VDEATCFDSDPNNDVWTVELDPERMELQRCDYNPTGRPSDRTKRCTFKLNTLSREGWGTVQANHPLKWRIIAQNTVCNVAVLRHNASIYQTLACPLTGQVGQSCGAWCYRGRTNDQHDGVDINAANGTVLRAPCTGTLRRIGGSYRCDPDNPDRTVPECGNGVRLTCKDRSVIVMCHLETITHPGGAVNAGEIIGTSDATGNACGCTPHLHLRVAHPQDTDPQRFWDVSCITGPSGIRDLTPAEQERCCRNGALVIRNCNNEPQMCPN
jgi:hypothetical protein